MKYQNCKDGKHWTTDDIYKFIANRFVKGEKVVITSGSIHKEIGLINRHPMVCSAMKRLMNEYQHEVISIPKSKQGATFTVRYFV